MTPSNEELSVGIMNVVTEVGANMDDEREPTWDEAMTALDAATPVEVVRSPRRITVVYRYSDGTFTATSPDLRAFRVTGRSLEEAKSAAREDLGRFLDPVVEVIERPPPPDPSICTAAAGHNPFRAAALPGVIVLSSAGTAHTFVTSLRTPRRVRVS